MNWTLLLERLVPQASTYARDLDMLFEFIFWLVGFWFVLTNIAFFWLLIRFRARPTATRPSTTTAASGS